MILGCFSHRDYAQRFISSGVPCVVALQHRLDAGEAIGFLERICQLISWRDQLRKDWTLRSCAQEMDLMQVDVWYPP